MPEWQRTPRILMRVLRFWSFVILQSSTAIAIESTHSAKLPKAFIDGTGVGWTVLGEQDFLPANGTSDPWSWKDGVVHCTGRPTGVMSTRKQYTNFELVIQWKHLESGGNSGLFVW